MPLASHSCPCVVPQAASEEEREHAELLMEYQNVRGGRVRLASMLQPETEFSHEEKVRHYAHTLTLGTPSHRAGCWVRQQFAWCQDPAWLHFLLQALSSI